MRFVRRFFGTYRLTAAGAPVLACSAFLATRRLGYTILVTLVSAAALLLVDSYVRHIVEKPEDD